MKVKSSKKVKTKRVKQEQTLSDLGHEKKEIETDFYRDFFFNYIDLKIDHININEPKKQIELKE